MHLGSPRPHINVTPMIDVMLVLMIIFMVTIPLIVEQVDLPRTANAPAGPAEPDEITLTIDRRGVASLEMSGQSVPALALREQLAALYRGRVRDRILYFKADSSLAFGAIEPALAAARDAGVRVLAAVTEQNVPRRVRA